MKNWKHNLLDRFAPYLLVLAIGLVLVLNSALVTGIQVAMDFPLQSPQEPFQEEGTWEFLDVSSNDRINGYILWQDHSQWRLVITERHFHTNRWRTVCDTILMVQDFEEEFTTSYGRILVKLHGYADFEHFNWIPSPVFRTLRVPTDFLLWNAGLLVLEIAALVVFRKIRGR